MYFNVLSDNGFEIQGYLIPDGFSAIPYIRVICDGKEFGPFECDIFLPGPYQHKHHATGFVGFHLHRGNVPGLDSDSIVEISDADTGLIFYRRLNVEKHIERRVFRLETQFVPHRELDRSLQPYFQFYVDGVERYGSETVRQMLEIANQPSTYVSGRVMLRNVQRYITDGTIRIASLRDPFYELAVRLWSVGSFKKRRLSFVSERDAIVFEPAASYFADVDFSDTDHVVSATKAAPRDIIALFESPFTHQLVASSPSDRIGRDGVSGALDALSQFNIFGANERDASLASDIAEFIGVPDNLIAFSPVRSPFLELSDALRGISHLEHVLENDLILFYFVRKAEHRARGGTA